MNMKWKELALWQKVGVIAATGMMLVFILYLLFGGGGNNKVLSSAPEVKNIPRQLFGVYEIKEGETVKDRDIYGKVVRAKTGEKFVIRIKAGKLNPSILYYNNSPLDPVHLKKSLINLRVVSAPPEGDVFRLIKTKREGSYLVTVQVSS